MRESARAGLRRRHDAGSSAATELVSVRPGEPARIRDGPPVAATAAAIVGSRAYIAHGDLLRVFPLKGAGSSARDPLRRRVRAALGARQPRRRAPARRARRGARPRHRAASARRRCSGSLAWLVRQPARGLRRRPRRAAAGRAAGTHQRRSCSPSRRARRTSATAMSIRRLAPGATARRELRTPSRARRRDDAARQRTATAWHSCEQSANSPLTS